MAFHFRYAGSLPGSSETVEVCRGGSYSAARLAWSINNDEDGELTVSWLSEDGSTWIAYYSSGTLSAPSVGSTNDGELYVGHLRTWKMEWVNGGTAQTTFQIQVAGTQRLPKGARDLFARYKLTELWVADKRTDVPSGDLTTWNGQGGAVATGSTAKPNLLASTPKIKDHPAVQFDAASSEFLAVTGLSVGGATQLQILVVGWFVPTATEQTILSCDGYDLSVTLSTTGQVRVNVGGSGNYRHTAGTLPNGLYCLSIGFNAGTITIRNWDVDVSSGTVGTIPGAVPAITATRLGTDTGGTTPVDAEVELLGFRVGSLMSAAQRAAFAVEMAALYDPALETLYAPDASYDAASGAVIASGLVTDLLDQAGSVDLSAPGGAEPGWTLADIVYSSQPTLTFDGTQWVDADPIAALLSGATAFTIALVCSVADTGVDQFVLSLGASNLKVQRWSDNRFYLTLGGGGNYVGRSGISAGKHVHIFRFAAGVVVWTLDGVTVTPDVSGGTLPAAVPTVTAGGLGSSSTLGNAPTTGAIKRLMVWDSDIGASQATALAAALAAEADALYTLDHMWLSASGAATAPGAVSTWSDQVGSQTITGVPGNEPTLTLANAAFADQPTVDFLGTSNQRCTAAGLQTELSGSSTFTLAVCGAMSAATDQAVVSCDVFDLFLYRHTASELRLYVGGAANYVGVNYDAALHSTVITFDAGVVTWVRDGIKVTSWDISGGTIPATVPVLTGTPYIGSTNAGGSSALTASVSHLVIQVTALSESEAIALSNSMLAEVT